MKRTTVANSVQALENSINAAIDKKIESGNKEIANDMIAADQLDVEADALLGMVNERLQMLPNFKANVPEEALPLLNQLSMLYLNLYAVVNTESSPTTYTSLMRLLKNNAPKGALLWFLGSTGLFGASYFKFKNMLGTLGKNPMFTSVNKAQTTSMFLGWLITNLLVGGMALWASQQPGIKLPPAAYPILQQIQAVEEQLKVYGINMKPFAKQ